MMIHDQSSPTPMEHSAPDVLATLAERTDDACSRIYQYQQQLRVDLLAAASDEATRPAARWFWLCTSSVRAIETRVRGLTESGASFAHRQAASLGLVVAEA